MRRSASAWMPVTEDRTAASHAKGDFAIITGALTANNQNEWIAFIKKRLEKYPDLEIEFVLKCTPSTW